MASAMAMLDADGDGDIDAAEWAAGYATLGKTAPGVPNPAVWYGTLPDGPAFRVEQISMQNMYVAKGTNQMPPSQLQEAPDYRDATGKGVMVGYSGHVPRARDKVGGSPLGNLPGTPVSPNGAVGIDMEAMMSGRFERTLPEGREKKFAQHEITPGYVSEARDRLRERLGKGVSTAQTKRMMLDVGADQHGRVSPRDFEVMVARFEEDRLVKKSRRKFWRRRAKKPPKAPKELYAPSAIHADAKALAKPLPKAAGCDWDQLLDAHGRDFEALFGQVNDATLQEATSAGNTIVHYLAQIGDVERLAVVLRRAVGRQIVHRRNARGHTALEYAAARGHDGVAQTLSCYNQEHLADEHVADKMLSHHATRSYRVARQASCAARGSMPK